MRTIRLVATPTSAGWGSAPEPSIIVPFLITRIRPSVAVAVGVTATPSWRGNAGTPKEKCCGNRDQASLGSVVKELRPAVRSERDYAQLDSERRRRSFTS
jgi:hypothetical protein